MCDEVDIEQDSLCGEPAQFDPTFRGPVKKRKCNDIICCFLFTAAILGYVLLGILAFCYGDPRHVLYPRNSTGWFCGIGPNKDRPNLFYFDILRCVPSVNVMPTTLNGFQCPITKVCVEKCPSSFWAVGKPSYLPTVKPASVFNQSLCVPSLHLENTTLTVKDIVDKELCPFFHMPTISVLGRCLPDVAALGKIPSAFSNIPGLPSVKLINSSTKDILKGFNARGVGIRILEDFVSSWRWILVGLLPAVVVSMLLLLLLRFPAPVRVRVAVILGALCPGVGVFPLYFVECTWIFITIFRLQGLKMIIALIQESSKAIGHMMWALLYPLVTFVLLLACVACWGSTALCLATAGSPIYKVVALKSTTSNCKSIIGTDNCDPQTFTPSDYPDCPSARCIFINYNKEGLLQMDALQFLNFVTFFWCVNFVLALSQCTLAGAFASYYWAFNKPGDIPSSPVWGGFMRSLRYHVGSLALGSFLLILETVGMVVLRVLNIIGFCCLLKANKAQIFDVNDYIMIAIQGKNYIISHYNAHMLPKRNIIRFIPESNIFGRGAERVFCCLKLLVAGAGGFLSFFFFSTQILLPGSTFRCDTLNYYWMPIVTVMFGSHLIAHCFFIVYNTAVETLFLCCMEDLECNDGLEQQPYYMAIEVRKLFARKLEKIPLPAANPPPELPPPESPPPESPPPESPPPAGLFSAFSRYL
ncbi:choline transporter-like protein 4 isoform X2 [Scophthalmus maximus]|uniref:choline transporter-like protein 4 isoform X2 n=1 Tax=Scophthalmus maximus TaxID=52904 RepID=UPI001FA901DD|nr:choline transporter-like protein 4 isoform X2 [Scophthalmus maximus]